MTFVRFLAFARNDKLLEEAFVEVLKAQSQNSNEK
jgi:hypothetical protein